MVLTEPVEGGSGKSESHKSRTNSSRLLVVRKVDPVVKKLLKERHPAL